MRIHWARVLLIFLGIMALRFVAGGQTFELLHTFTFVDGDWPRANLVQGSDRNLYGSTFYGGSPANRGTLFRISPQGDFTLLAVLNHTNGWVESDLIEASDGNFYGTSSLGGANQDGAVFRVSPDGIHTQIASFNFPTGRTPSSGVIQAADGSFYGTTRSGGEYKDFTGSTMGTIFKMTPDGELTRLSSFDGTNGAVPATRLLQASDGNFYGTTQLGGVPPVESFGAGTIFRMTPAGEMTTLARFNGTNGVKPLAPLIQASDGNLYGTTAYGGTYGNGTVFRMTLDGLLTTLVRFDGTNGAGPGGELVEWFDGNFYGATAGGGEYDDGTIFKLTPEGELIVLFSFNYWSSTGGYPNGLTLGRDGHLYGTAAEGGGNLSGTIFRIVMPGPELNFACEEGQLILSWATNRAGFVLQSTSTLDSEWDDHSTSPVVAGNHFFVTNSLAENRCFFRLRRSE